jgi:hypothetical protein
VLLCVLASERAVWLSMGISRRASWIHRENKMDRHNARSGHLVPPKLLPFVQNVHQQLDI